jgi:glutathione S-transferase
LDLSFSGPQLIPSDPRFAGLTEQWVSLINTVIDVTLIRTYLLAYAAPRTNDGKPDQTIIDAVTPAVRLQLGVLDDAVAKTGYLVGDKFTLADINLMPVLYYIRQLPEGAVALDPVTHLGRLL